MTLHFILIASVGLILLGSVRDAPWVRRIAIAVTVALALGTSVAALALIALGHRMHWTSDGPGILGVMLALLVCGAFALLGWGGVWRQVTRPRGGTRTLWVGAALLVVGLSGAVLSTEESRRQSKPSHDAEVVQLAFDAGGDVLYSLDADGMLKAWNASNGDPLWSWRDPALAGATSFAVAADGHHALVSAGAGAQVLDLDAGVGASLAAHLSDAPLATFVRDDRIAIARGTRLVVVDLRATGESVREISFDTDIDALACSGGTLVVATHDGAVTFLAADGDAAAVRREIPAPVQRVVVSPEGVRVVGVSSEQRAWIVAREGAVTEAPLWMEFGHTRFLDDDLVVAAGDRMPELRALQLSALRSSPFLNHGIGVTALATSPTRRRVAVAFGDDVHLTGSLGADPRAVTAARLIDPRS